MDFQHEGHRRLEKEDTIPRLFYVCPSIDHEPIERLQTTCNKCRRYAITCCQHKNFSNSLFPCHHYKVVYTDGACTNNGQPGSISAIGGTMGDDPEYCWSIKVDDEMDYGQRRTSQRAEMLAAMQGLVQLAMEHGYWDSSKPNRHQTETFKEADVPYFVVATDSEYVVKGITDWYPKWKRNNWRTTNGTRPTNLDLFDKLIGVIEQMEEAGWTVEFWHIPRRYNQKADALATAATRT
ncbi:ribonuclease H-like protein [Cylindrobasidium torrendii FP15055 ss-10]|uniref:ribonuclease H n=1 Tax=Cylindrobasidium torrendii FP15055 ss-10 TaxID=1314674 RepID=A0A0D7B1I3_9AGAR|nr:ribonuclease H-like protein [Cylindrobasidium torrendii FP15055 ss-10]